MSKPTKGDSGSLEHDLGWSTANGNVQVPGQKLYSSPATTNTGWVLGQEPPHEWMNWWQFCAKLWQDYFIRKTETTDPKTLRGTVTWSGTQLSFGSPIQIVFNPADGGASKINSIAAVDSPISVSDGQVLIVNLDRTTTGTITAMAYPPTSGKYSVVAESSLDGTNFEQMFILFRRRGTVIEVPITGDVIPAGGTLDEVAGALIPIGTILPWDDFNGVLSFDTTVFKYCDGTLIVNVNSPINGQTIRDLSGRALVGFGTDGGGNIGAAGVLNIVGNAGNTVDLTHDHSVPGLSIPSLSVSGSTGTGTTGTGTTGTGTTGTGTTGTGTTGTGTTGNESSHTHGVGTLQFQTMQAVTKTAVANGYVTAFDSSGNPHFIVGGFSAGGGSTGYFIKGTAPGGEFTLQGDANQSPFGIFGAGVGTVTAYTANGSGTTGAGSAHNHSIPGLSVPGLSVPGLSVPGLSVPGLSVPSLSVSGSTGVGTTGGGTTGNGLGVTNIQPISSQVRFIMRIA